MNNTYGILFVMCTNVRGYIIFDGRKNEDFDAALKRYTLNGTRVTDENGSTHLYKGKLYFAIEVNKYEQKMKAIKNVLRAYKKNKSSKGNIYKIDAVDVANLLNLFDGQTTFNPDAIDYYTKIK